MIRALREASLLIRHRALPTKELFTELSRYEFFSRIEGDNFREDWVRAANEMDELQEGELSVIKSIGAALGTSDVQGQLSMLEVNTRLLESYAEQAREQYMKKGKLYRTMGLLAGLFVAVLII